MAYGILVGKPKEPTGYRWIEPIYNWGLITNKEHYCCDHPCWYEDMRKRNFTCSKEEIVTFDEEKAVATIGNNYKVPDEAWRYVL